MRAKKLTQAEQIKRLEKVCSMNYVAIANLEKNLLGVVKELKEIGKLPEDAELTITDKEDLDINNISSGKDE